METEEREKLERARKILERCFPTRKINHRYFSRSDERTRGTKFGDQEFVHSYYDLVDSNGEIAPLRLEVMANTCYCGCGLRGYREKLRTTAEKWNDEKTLYWISETLAPKSRREVQGKFDEEKFYSLVKGAVEESLKLDFE